jgi:hypothetical protein
MWLVSGQVKVSLVGMYGNAVERLLCRRFQCVRIFEKKELIGAAKTDNELTKMDAMVRTYAENRAEIW